VIYFELFRILTLGLHAHEDIFEGFEDPPPHTHPKNFAVSPALHPTKNTFELQNNSIITGR
jgi:hypothetical protein